MYAITCDTNHHRGNAGIVSELQSALEAGDRKIDLWYARHRMARADFSHCPEVFDNINTPEQRERMANG